MLKKFTLCLLCLGVLAACGGNRETIIKDPLFQGEGQEQYMVFDKFGKKATIMRDPIFPQDNWLIFPEMPREEVN